MKSRTQGIGTTWTLDGDILTVFIPMTWKRRGGRKVITALDGGDAWAPTKARPDETLIHALARAHRWNRMLEGERYRSAAEIAAAKGIGRSFVQYVIQPSTIRPAAACSIALLGAQREGDVEQHHYCQVAERYWDRVGWAIKEYGWRFEQPGRSSSCRGRF